ncbi:MATE family efflux transporter [Lachnoclostridium sp. An14]|uniref:MATE family efflux transporter n=1 Tax=Lachnoclostridium sp. An14 TaxID=1965562 RepID=UPI000B37E0D3|nr:MATE family efflux transporter [Lachnoclostridium sp. An14]OUQ13797.1 MATE family efflux transporter [Lachnoclostridium sp. An14]
MADSKTFLGTEPIGGLLAKLALPTVAAQLINMLYNIVDRIYIGHIPGEGAMALTGVGVCMPIIMVVSAFASLVGYGGSPRASIYMGKNDQKTAESILGNCFALLVLISLGLTAVLLVWSRPLLLTFGASENTIGYAVSYMNIYACGTLFVQLTLGMNAFITAQGFAKTGMLSVLIGAVCNIVLDPVFIFVFDMGVPGAALATILSQAVSCIWVLAFLFGKKTVLRIRRENLRLSAPVILPCVALGLATFIMQTSESILSVCFNSSLLKYGGDIAVGAMTILSSVMQFAMLPLQGLGQGAQPIISYNYGAGNGKRVKDAFFLLLKCSVIYSLLLWLSVELAPHLFAGIFTSNPELVEFSSGALRIYMAGMFLFGVQMACQMTFNSLGNAKASIAVAVVRKFVLLIPLIYAMPLLFSSSPEAQTRAIYMAEPIADILAVTFTATLFYFQFRKALRPFAQKKNVV